MLTLHAARCMLHAASWIAGTRNSLHVNASEKGVVVGRIQFRDDGDLIDCTLMGVRSNWRAHRTHTAYDGRPPWAARWLASLPAT
jgi:hypothetical protein